MSSRRKPGSSNNLNCLDSGFHRNDDIAFMQRFLNNAFVPFISFVLSVRRLEMGSNHIRKRWKRP